MTLEFLDGPLDRELERGHWDGNFQSKGLILSVELFAVFPLGLLLPQTS